MKLTIVLPSDFVAQRANISIGSGSLQAGELQAEDLILDVGVGSCKANDISAERATLRVGIGHMEIHRFFAKQTRLDVGLGHAEITLTQKLDNFSYEVDVGLGSVRVGSSHYSGTATESNENPGAPYNLDIRCGLGRVEVKD